MRAGSVWRLTAALGVAFVLLSGQATASATAAHPAPAASAAPTTPTAADDPVPTAPPAPDVFEVGLDPGHGNDPGLWMQWTLLDRSDDRRIGSASSTTARTNSESSIKAWISTDYLRDAQQDGRSLSPAQLAVMDRAIKASDDNAAETMYRSLGRDQIFADLDRTCGVHVTTARRAYWSYAQITALNATQILDCVLDKAPNYPHGDRLLDDLHHVNPDNAFGIPQALGPDVPVAVKNGWTAHSGPGVWNVNCVAAWDHYALAVLTRYPIGRGLDAGAGVCRDVTSAVVRALD